MDSTNVVWLDPDIQRHVRSRMARLPELVQTIHELGLPQLNQLLNAYFEGMDDVFFELADGAGSNAEQNLFFDAMREVRVQRKAMEKRFFNTLEEAFARLVGEDNRDFLTDMGELSEDALSIAHNDDLDQLVALEDTIDRAGKRFDKDMQAITSALDGVMESEVNHERNPFGPTVLCMAAMSQVKRLDINIKAKLVLFSEFEKRIIDRLDEFHAQLNCSLQEQGVSLATGDATSLNNGSGADASGSGDTDPASHTQLLELLSFLQRLPVTKAVSSARKIVDLLSQVQQQRNQALRLSVVQRECISMVEILFDYILDNQRLPEPFQEQVLRLQIPVVKIALLDSSFLENRSHPARLFVNELVSVASHWYDAEVQQKDPIFVSARRIIDRITHRFEQDVELFKEAHQEFCLAVEKEERRAKILEQRTIDAEAGKAKAEEARQTVLSEVKMRVASYALPKVVVLFIDGPWSNVLFVTGLKYGFSSTQWAEQLKVLSDLVQSVQVPADKKQRKYLIQLVPDLNVRIRRGLDSISYNPFEISEIFKQLEEVHLCRIRGEELEEELIAPVDDHRPTPEGDRPTEETLPEASSAHSMASSKGLTDEPKMDIGVRTQNDSAARSGPEQDGDGSTDAPVDAPVAPHLATVRAFSPGTWFSYSMDDEEPLRCRLAAFIKPTGKFIFVNRSGSKVAESTENELADALREGRLRTLDSSMLFDKALESVVSGLRKHSSMDLNLDQDR